MKFFIFHFSISAIQNSFKTVPRTFFHLASKTYFWQWSMHYHWGMLVMHIWISLNYVMCIYFNISAQWYLVPTSNTLKNNTVIVCVVRKIFYVLAYEMLPQLLFNPLWIQNNTYFLCYPRPGEKTALLTYSLVLFLSNVLELIISFLLHQTLTHSEASDYIWQAVRSRWHHTPELWSLSST